MKKIIFKTIFIWLVWMSITSLHFEYIINRPINGYVQLGLTFVVISITLWLIGKTVNNLITNKKQKQND